MIEYFKTLWNSNWKNKAMLIFGAFVLVGAVVGVTCGVIQGQ